MKPSKRKLALVAPAEKPAPGSRDERLAAAKEFLGEKYCCHPKYQPRVRVGSILTAWAADFARGRQP